MKIEWLPFIMNAVLTGYYMWNQDLWRSLYWGGATILTAGLLLSHGRT